MEWSDRYCPIRHRVGHDFVGVSLGRNFDETSHPSCMKKKLLEMVYRGWRWFVGLFKRKPKEVRYMYIHTVPNFREMLNPSPPKTPPNEG